ncbi:E3 ubiquitin-protein ligase RNF26 [Synchiropus splendidus]|uniref:E3 ubiquitin-protein ligase RNF26 n=1 Tax=Synchiropus splendidus TaxID=270530 RepID=UPI00237E08E3|nr:E3 ubiquitin-protein ligase RNF26 [Synchiropus splendidus]
MGLAASVVFFVVTLTEWFCLLLDLNFLLVHSIVQTVLAVARFVQALPSLCVGCCVSAAATVSCAAGGLLGSLLLAVEGLLEGAKMAGYLCAHLVLRGKEQLHRSLEAAVEGLDIALSLALYFTNTVINLLLMAAQKLLLALAWLLQVTWAPLNRILEALLTLLHSSLLATAALLWPLLDFSVTFVHMFSSVFILNFYGLMLTLAVALTTAAYLNPRAARRGWLRLLDRLDLSPAARRLHAAAAGFLQSCLQDGQEVMRAAARRCRRLRSVLERFQLDLAQGRSHIRLQHPPRVGGDGEPGEERRVPPDGSAEEAAHAEPGSPSCSVEKKRPPPEDLFTLFTEQEERKRCVICQDRVKTVVLLPCRHLCLCRDCSGVLQRQPIYQQNCPLCRRMILNTVDVYL